MRGTRTAQALGVYLGGLGPLPATLLVATSIVVIGAVDLYSGIEYRIFPLYFLPLTLAAWSQGRRAALAAAVGCALVWFGSNYLAGMRFGLLTWAVNITTQGVAFLVVGYLIASLRAVLDHERTLSRTDPLTGLPNTRAFFEAAGRILAIARRHDQWVTLAYLDLDGFKRVNDTLGHHAGDAMLQQAGALLMAGVRAGDLVVRLGGDEFVALFPQTGPDGARAQLDRLRTTLVDTLSRETLPVAVSIGAVACRAPSLDLDALLRQADQRMYAAKAAGKNRLLVDTFEPQAPAPGSE